jgi:hypothetical protein
MAFVEAVGDAAIAGSSSKALGRSGPVAIMACAAAAGSAQ